LRDSGLFHRLSKVRSCTVVLPFLHRSCHLSCKSEMQSWISSVFIVVFSCSRVLVFSCSRVLVFSCSRVLVFSCSRVLCVLVFSRSLCSRVLAFFVFSCFHVLVFSLSGWSSGGSDRWGGPLGVRLLGGDQRRKSDPGINRCQQPAAPPSLLLPRSSHDGARSMAGSCSAHMHTSLQLAPTPTPTLMDIMRNNHALA
jgi:hypothetical protein